MAGRSFISRAFGILRELFRGLTSEKVDPRHNAQESGSDLCHLDSQKQKTQAAQVISTFDPRIETQFVFNYSNNLKQDVERLSIKKQLSSSSVMPETLTPTLPAFGFNEDNRDDLHSLISVFNPVATPVLSTTVGIDKNKKQFIADKLLDYRSRLSDVDHNVRMKRFDEASHINDELISSIEDKPQFSDCLKQAMGNVSVIAAAKHQFELEEEERKIREEQERKRVEKERQRAEKKRSLLSDISQMLSCSENGNWMEGDSLKAKLLTGVQVFNDSELSVKMTEATGKYEEKRRSYLAQQERQKREVAERKAREEQERIQREKERIQREKRESLEASIQKLENLTQNSHWAEANSLKEELLIEVPAFNDSTLTTKLAAIVAELDSKYSDFKADRDRRESQQRELAEKKRMLKEQALRNKRIDDAKGSIVAFEKAITSSNWAECSRIKLELDQLVVTLNDGDLTNRYNAAVTHYNTAIGALDQKQRENEERERRIKHEQEQREIEEAYRRVKEAEAERQRQIRLQYIRVPLSNGGECLCIHDYYPKSGYGENVSPAQKAIRETVYSFKDKFNSKSPTQIMSARTTISNAVCSVINKLYPGDQHNLWFCTAQASTPESAVKRFKYFCQMVSNASGVNDGFDLISVTGVKASASTGGGTRGDISNLSFDPALINGKRIILFDDIITSGKTMAAIRNALLRSGAVSVDCIAYGRTV